MPRLFPPLARLSAALALVAAVAPGASAQYNTVPDAGAYALRGVTVVAADGRQTPNMTIVVRDGRIAAMAANATVAPGVRVLEGDSLFVYPGLVDAQGGAKFAFTEPTIDRAQVQSWDPPRSLQGFTPARRVADALQATGTDLAAARQAGVVAAAVHPEPGLMPGQGALLVYRAGARTPSDLIVNPSVGQLFGFRGGRGVYPGTLFGVVAMTRQAFEDARRSGVISASYDRTPAGALTAPGMDADYAALQDVIAGRSRVFYVANSSTDIIRALQLGEELGFTPVIVGGQEAWKVADELKRRNATVLVSLDLPRPRRWVPPTDGAPMTGAMADSAKAKGAQDDAAVMREKQQYEEVYANAGKLAAAGVRFAITSGGGKADLREGTRTLIRYGLSEQDALRALTTTPAELFGIAPITRVAAGVPATFVVTSGPMFEKDTRVAYTFVEGMLERGKPGTPARAATTTANAGTPGAPGPVRGGETTGGMLAGSWNMEIAAPQGTLTGVMRLTSTGETFTGTISSEMGELPVTNGRMTAGNVSMTVTFPFMQNAQASFTGTMAEGRITGTAVTPVGEINWSATRSGPPGPGLDREQEEDEWEGHSHGPPPVRRPEPPVTRSAPPAGPATGHAHPPFDR